MERGTINVILKMRELIAHHETFVGTVITVDYGNGRSLVQTVGGGARWVRGTDVGTGNKCLVRDGEIISTVPVTAYVEVEV